MPPSPSHIAIIGGGPAGLMAAEVLADQGLRVTVYDRMPTVGRKFLMAGRGGLNLTHSEPLATFMPRYGDRAEFLKPIIEAFPPAAVIKWCEDLGQPTFVGTSGRIFPKAFKASPLLRAWMNRLVGAGVTFALQHRWTGWRDGKLSFESPAGEVLAQADAVILALGGASWPKLGSDGAWTHFIDQTVSPLRPANCGLSVIWSDVFKTRFAGQPLKSIAVTYAGKTVQGELMITQTGIEGTPAYALAAHVREDLAKGAEPVVEIDLRPALNLPDLNAKLKAPRKRQSLSTFLQKAAGLSPIAIGLVHESLIAEPTEDLARRIKALPLRITGTSGLERAISSAGGLELSALDANLMLKTRPGVFAAGEMLDWEAPTGGYLLQGCMSTGVAAAQGVAAWLSHSREER